MCVTSGSEGQFDMQQQQVLVIWCCPHGTALHMHTGQSILPSMCYNNCMHMVMNTAFHSTNRTAAPNPGAHIKQHVSVQTLNQWLNRSDCHQQKLPNKRSLFEGQGITETHAEPNHGIPHVKIRMTNECALENSQFRPNKLWKDCSNQPSNCQNQLNSSSQLCK